jgi:[acyl-carrier-protein] S-malonyltransferase
MLADLSGRFPVIRETYSEASDVLSYDLWALVCDGPAEDLDRTERTQPAMLAGGVAVWRAWQGMNGPMPSKLAGHSLGEYTALVCAGTLAFADALKAVRHRGELMQSAVPAGEGAMAAILGLDDDAVRAACSDAADGQVVEAVNLNAPGQVVIAGEKAAVERTVELAKARGAKLTKVLPVSVPSHCSLMRPAAERLAEYLGGVQMKPPSIPVVQNVTAAEHGEVAEIRSALVAQLYSPVQWVRSIETLCAAGMAAFLECGPGNVLTGLGRRINRSVAAQSMQDCQGLEKGLSLVTENR